ncbi:NCS1 family transporter [Grimontia hollisae]|uniref:NCS1 family transporter n=1 Tax=Grimontia hollisae TaxID=673 RepID=UPI001303898E|nr:NCS1 family transporter [Grimontia hollisae]
MNKAKGIARTVDNPTGENHLIEESILPVWLNQRTISFWGFIAIWIGMAVIIATFSLGAGGVSGMPLEHVLLTIFLANLTLGIVMTLTADIGTEHGLSFAVYLRAPFGTFGTHLPAVSRGVVAAIWFGIQTYLGALALNGIFEYLTGFTNWYFWYGIFGIVQIINTAYGIRAVKTLANLATPAIIAISIWMYYSLDGIAKTKGINIWNFEGKEEISFLVLFVANMSWWSALAVDIPNLTRFLKTEPGTKSFFKRNRNVFVAQFLALPLTQTWIALIGAASFITTGDWNPINVIQGQESGLGLIVLLLMVVLAQWSTNNSANLIPAALTFVNAAAPKMTYKFGVILAGIIGTLSMPWLILNNLFTFLGYYGAILSAIAGIIVADYYVIRRRHLNVPDLFNQSGQFKYIKGINPAAYIAWFIGGSSALASFNYAYLVGFPIAFITYLVLMKFWILPTYKQKEVTSNFNDEYLATSEGMNWVHEGNGHFSRKTTRELESKSLKREDL